MSADLAALELRIARLEDLEQIKALKSRYHIAINDTRFEDVGSLFSEDASVKLGYLMPSDQPVVGRSAISAGFAAMRTNTEQSQVKQFLHSHLVDLHDSISASGTGTLLACYGRGEESYLVAGKYSEEYTKQDGRWLFARMDLALYFTVPLAVGWAGHKRHYLVNSGQMVPDYPTLLPNPAV